MLHFFNMAGKDKLRKFKENETFRHVIQPTREEVMAGFEWKGKWAEFFGNDHPIVLELGCGKGEYSVNLGKAFPHKNFIGIDVKGARIWRGAKTVQEDNMSNVVFLRSQIELIEGLFAENEISEIWITFPDPQIKYKRAKHRLTHPIFLRRYFKLLNAEGIIHLKTDSEFLHGYTHGVVQMEGHEVLFANHNVYKAHTVTVPSYVTEIKTFYEAIFLKEDKAITYLQFKLKF